jgi:hypothetical protein
MRCHPVRSLVRSLPVLLLAAGCAGTPPPDDGGPPLAPAAIEQAGDRLILSYAGGRIFEGTITSSSGFSVRPVVSDRGGIVEQAILLESGDLRGPLRLEGIITGGPEAFTCEVDPPRSGPPIVRHASGPSRSLRNRAVYERGRDWVLSVDLPARARLRPVEGVEGLTRFTLEAEGAYLVLRFRPRYYQRHRGLRYFEPWTYRVWDRSVAGWCSWFAYSQAIDEGKIRRAAEVFAERLHPFGYDYFQIDDGYQRDPGGPPGSWLVPNDKFPSGLTTLASHIRAQGLQPGIWTYASFHDADYVAAHPDRFVRDTEGSPVQGRWVGYVMDASVPGTLEEIVRPLYRGLRDMGWSYFKVDALRHLRYEGFNSFPGYFETKGLDRVEVFRDYARAVREEIGPESFMLGCWGIRPELTGLIDGCRIGGDGFGYAGLAQYNSFNNVVWRNDPDHVELSPQEAWRSCTVTTLTGSLLMLTDPPERYEGPLAEPARRAAPVLCTRPGQLYDVDPSRSRLLDRVDTEVSGDGERVFDASRAPATGLFLLEVARDWGDWVVLGRLDENVERLSARDLGLDPERTYTVFEFWTGRAAGTFRGSFEPGPIDPRFGCQAFIIRERRERPQVLATSRHLTGGGPDLAAVLWSGRTLSGASTLVGGDPYVLYLDVPEGFVLQNFRCLGAEVTGRSRSGRLLQVTLETPAAAVVTWKADF